jgi:hypothetical protein
MRDVKLGDLAGEGLHACLVAAEGYVLHLH